MTETVEVTALLEDMRAEMAALKARLALLEKEKAIETAPAPAAVAATPAPATVPVVAEGISEEEVLAISAALAAWFGVRVHIRQIRLISSRAWAQEGRVSIQASHQLHN
jgi:methylmalonyl-CoA carboxyltransferase large subunit